MSDINVKGIVLGGINYKEKDKILSVFTLEKGLISCKLVGALSAKAKLKFVKEPFCFADFILNLKNITSFNDAIYTITSANVIESFYDLTLDYEKYVCGCAILEIIKKVAQKENPNELLFIETIKALKVLTFDNIDPQLVLTKFMVSIFQAMGYALSLNKCSCCGDNFIGKRFFNYESGDIVCLSCKRPNAVEISSLLHANLRLAHETEYENLKNLKLKKEGLKQALNLLVNNFERRFETLISSVNKLP